ncbi:target of Sbf [Naviculisporaceae sp. PSN 640]
MKAKLTAATVLASAAGMAKAMQTSHELCAQTSFFEKGNWYCKPVSLITYENVGRAGTYQEVVNMDQQTGECQFAERDIRGPLAPFNEPMSFHFRGPLILKQFAVYLPNTGRYKVKRKRDQVKRHRKRSDEENSSSSNLSDSESGEGEYVYQYQDYIALYEHAEEQKRLFLEGSSSPSNKSELSLKVPPPLPQGTGTPQPRPAPSPEPEAKHNPQPEEAPSPSAEPDRSTGAGYRQNITHQNSAPEATPSINPTLEDHNPPNEPFSAIHTPQLSNTPLARTAYYHADTQRSEGLIFLGNYGGQGSGLWTPTFGNTLSYINSHGTGGSPRPEVISNITLPSGKEFAIFSSQPCSSSSPSADPNDPSNTCGYYQPGSIAYRGFGDPSTPDKLFLMEFSMPHDTDASNSEHFQFDMPAIWMLNARIPLTSQYHACSCWASGCGEFDVVEVLDPGNDKAKTTFHAVAGGGDGNYFARPVKDTVTVAVVFDGEAGAVSVKVLSGQTGGEFPTWLSVDEIKRYWQEDVGLYGQGGGSSSYRIP